jgi:2-methylcitrate dehydratase PrpD
LEKKSGEISQPLVQGLKVVEHEASYLASKGFQVYERRHEFGPHLVVGSALTIGGLVALRRGRFSGAISGALTAGLTYVTLYELTPLDDLSDLFRKND